MLVNTRLGEASLLGEWRQSAEGEASWDLLGGAAWLRPLEAMCGSVVSSGIVCLREDRSSWETGCLRKHFPLGCG